MRPTISQMLDWFNEFNRVVFENKLPRVPIKFNNTYRQLGQFYWGASGIGIKISLFYDRTEEQYRNCLLHEMCHLYCYNQGWRDEHHGHRWQAIADKAYRLTGLYIQRCEDIKGWKPAKGNGAKAAAVKAKKDAPAILVDLDCGSYHFIVKTTKSVLQASSSDGRIKGVYITDNERVKRWQTSRSLHRGYKFGYYDYKHDIVPMLEKAIKVEDIRKLCLYGEYDCLGIR